MKEWKKVLLLTLTALVLRVFLYFLFSRKNVVGGDQIQNILLAKKFASGDFYGVLDVYWTPLYPILIGILTFFVDTLILPSVIISVVAGSLAVAITYYFVKQSYGEKEAFIAAIIAIFFPHLINSVFGLGTENIYLLIIIGSLFVGWKGLQESSAKLYFFAGILIGLAYLTRPEAFGYIVFFILFAFVKDFWGDTKFSKNSLKMVGTFLLGFAILATPYLLYLRAETGIWTISGKMGVNVAAGIFDEGDDDEEVEEVGPVSDEVANKTLLTSFVLSLFHIQKIFAFLMPVLLFIFIGLGLFGDRWKKERLRREVYLISFCLFTIFGYALAVSEPRYFYMLLPIFFGWIAIGIFKLYEWFQKSASDWVSENSSINFNAKYFIAGCLIFILLYGLPIYSFTRSNEKLWKDHAYEERAAGLWIKENSKGTPLIFSASRRPVFYAEGQQLYPTTTDTDEIFAEIKNQKADYVVLSERNLRKNSFLENFEKIMREDSDFELVYQKNQQPGYGILIFKRK